MFRRILLPALTATSLMLSACGSSDDDTPAASSPASTPATTAAATSAGAVVESGEVTVVAKEMSFAPSLISTTSGKLKITLKNDGTMVHELVVLKTSTPPSKLKVTDGQVSEADSIGEIADVAPGQSASHTFKLKPGKYVIVCNVPGHYAAGMFGQIVVNG